MKTNTSNCRWYGTPWFSSNISLMRMVNWWYIYIISEFHFFTWIKVIAICWNIMTIPDSKVQRANKGPSGADRSQVGPTLAPWTLLSDEYAIWSVLLSVIKPMGYFKWAWLISSKYTNKTSILRSQSKHLSSLEPKPFGTLQRVSAIRSGTEVGICVSNLNVNLLLWYHI